MPFFDLSLQVTDGNGAVGYVQNIFVGASSDSSCLSGGLVLGDSCEQRDQVRVADGHFMTLLNFGIVYRSSSSSSSAQPASSSSAERFVHARAL